MSNIKFFEFTKTDFEYFVKEGMLDTPYKEILEYKIRGYSIVKIADLLNMSTSLVSLRVKELKEKIIKML